MRVILVNTMLGVHDTNCWAVVVLSPQLDVDRLDTGPNVWLNFYHEAFYREALVSWFVLSWQLVVTFERDAFSCNVPAIDGLRWNICTTLLSGVDCTASSFGVPYSLLWWFNVQLDFCNVTSDPFSVLLVTCNNQQGSGATEDCCSKCFLENQKKMNSCQVITPAQQHTESPKKVDLLPVNNIAPNNTSTQPMDIDISVSTDPVSVMSPAKDETLIKKKKKKTSYKAMMAAMTTSDAPRDLEKEKEAIRKATGGGVFSKIDKI
jgi:hypothetical protein